VDNTSLAPESPPAPPPDLGPSGGGLPSWLELLRSLVFWGLTLAILGYLIKTYLDDHPELLQQFKRFKLLAFILELFGQLWSWLRQWTQAGMAILPRRKLGGDAASIAGLAGQSLSWLNLRRLTPRERVLYYYLNTLRRAEQKGVVREKDQTPYEYEPRLARSAPEVQTEIHELTDSFVQARYSQEEFSESHASLVQRLWQKIRRALRNPHDGDNGRG
jgi:hypothetical protein